MGKESEKKKNTIRRDKVLKTANKKLPEFPRNIAGLEAVSYTHLTLPTTPYV